MKEVGEVYDKQKIQGIYEEIKDLLGLPSWYIGGGFSVFKLYSAIDFNYDGVDDYLVSPISIGNSVYSYDGKYYKIKPMWKNPSQDTYGTFYFPSSNKTCTVIGAIQPEFYVTTNGKNYYLENSCYLTELMR